MTTAPARDPRTTRASLGALVLLALAAAPSCGGAPPPSASAQAAHALGPLDVVITHARVYGAAAGIDAVAIRGSKIASVGTSADLTFACTPPCAVVDAADGYLSPGFHDGHVHLATAGAESEELLVRGASIPDIQAAVKAFAGAHPDAPWILGHGFSAVRFLSPPTRADLDAVEPTRPVALTDHTGHNLWTNTAALRAAGITKKTHDPPGGSIQRDAHGEPTGYFVDAGRGLVLAKAPPVTEEARERMVLAGERLSLEKACTSAQGGPVTLDIAKTYARLDREGKLHERAFLWGPLLAPEPVFNAWVAFAHELPKDGKVQVVALKGFADGTLEARTAALLAPYEDDPANRGKLYVPQDALNRAVVRANRAGFPAAIHAIGDAAVRSALDAFEASKAELGHHLMNRVEHASLVDPADAKRFGALGVAASVQPVWLYGFPSRASLGSLAGRLGSARLARLYPWNDLAKGGALLVFGSDFPSSDLFDPISGIFAAARREVGDGDIVGPDQRLAFELAYRAYTESPAVAVGQGDRLGKIAAGYEADLVLLERDPRASAKSLKDAPLKKMWIAGRAVTP